MLILTRLGEFLGTPLGSFVYHLLLLLAVEATLAMAWGEWRRARDVRARRLLLAMAGLAGARILYIGAVLLTAIRLVPLASLPPLERLADTVSICCLGWGILRVGLAEARIWGWLFAANLLAALVCGVTFQFLWIRVVNERPGLDYTLFWQSTVWSAWQMALAALVGLVLIRNLRSTAVGASRVPFSTAVGPVLFLFLGGLFQLVLAGQVPRIPTWVRLSNLAAYPLIVVVIYQGIVATLRLQAEQLQEISQASLDQIKSLLLLVEGARQISGSLSLPSVLDSSVRGVARALDADQCAIVLPEETEPGYVSLACVYNAQAGKPLAPRGEAVTFPLDYQLTIQQAMRRKKAVMVDDPDNVQLRVLFNLLGSSEAGPLLVQPLLDDGETIGAILVGNSLTGRPFTPSQAKLCQSMADQVVVALQNARRYQDAQDRIKELHRFLSDQRRGFQEASTSAGRGSRSAGEPVLSQFPSWEEESGASGANLLTLRPPRSAKGEERGEAKPRGPTPRLRASSGQGNTGS